jgi:hypothetical protein
MNTGFFVSLVEQLPITQTNIPHYEGFTSNEFEAGLIKHTGAILVLRFGIHLTIGYQKL